MIGASETHLSEIERVRVEVSLDHVASIDEGGGRDALEHANVAEELALRTNNVNANTINLVEGRYSQSAKRLERTRSNARGDGDARGCTLSRLSYGCETWRVRREEAVGSRSWYGVQTEEKAE